MQRKQGEAMLLHSMGGDGDDDGFVSARVRKMNAARRRPLPSSLSFVVGWDPGRVLPPSPSTMDDDDDTQIHRAQDDEETVRYWADRWGWRRKNEKSTMWWR